MYGASRTGRFDLHDGASSWGSPWSYNLVALAITKRTCFRYPRHGRRAGHLVCDHTKPESHGTRTLESKRMHVALPLKHGWYHECFCPIMIMWWQYFLPRAPQMSNSNCFYEYSYRLHTHRQSSRLLHGFELNKRV